jgi:hypothetical protein
MRISPLRHNLARLRALDFVKLGQKEMADLAGCSTRTIQSVELGTLGLSEDLARRISNVTGVAAHWLLENNLKAPPNSKPFEQPYTREDYERARKSHDLGVSPGQMRARFLHETWATIFSAWMRAIFAGHNGDIALWRVSKLLEQLDDRHGHDQSIVPFPHLRFADLRDWGVLRKHHEIGLKLTEKYARKWRKGEPRRGKHGGKTFPFLQTRPKTATRRQRKSAT